MKLSFTTLGCPDWSFEKILDEGRNMGFTGIEVRGIDREMRADKIPLFFPENAEKTKAALHDKGITIVGFGTSVYFHNDENYENALEEGRLAIDVCERMGIPGIRVFGDTIEGDPSEIIEKVAKGLRILCEYAKDKSVKVLLEIHGNFNRLETVMPVVEKVKDCPAFGIIWDIEHSYKVYEENWPVFYEGIKPWICHTHFKDVKKVGDKFEICIPGDGVVPMDDIYRRLVADGYQGWYSLEWEKMWHPELPEPEVAFPRFIDYMKKL